MRELAEVLLRTPAASGSLTSAEREMIAAFVSARNECHFCQASHSAAAAHHLGGDYSIVDAVKADYRIAKVSEKLKHLLSIAAKVQQDGRLVSTGDVERARAAGASDVDIHDTVLIAAAFCMVNRYVDGLATLTPNDPSVYDEMGRRMAQHGYVQRS